MIFFSIAYCYIAYFLLVLARKSKFTIFAFTSHKVFKECSEILNRLGSKVLGVKYTELIRSESSGIAAVIYSCCVGPL